MITHYNSPTNIGIKVPRQLQGLVKSKVAYGFVRLVRQMPMRQATACICELRYLLFEKFGLAPQNCQSLLLFVWR